MSPRKVVKIHVCSNGAFDITRDGNQLSAGLCTDDMGPINRQLTTEEHEQLAAVLGVDKVHDMLAGLKLENQRLRESNTRLAASTIKLRKVLRLFRDFCIHGAAVWKLGTNHHHPMWEMVAESLGEDNDRHPTQKEWAFIWPENRAPLED